MKVGFGMAFGDKPMLSDARAASQVVAAQWPVNLRLTYLDPALTISGCQRGGAQ